MFNPHPGQVSILNNPPRTLTLPPGVADAKSDFTRLFHVEPQPEPVSDDVLWAVSTLATRKTSGGVLDISHTVAVMRAPTEAMVKEKALSQAQTDLPSSQGWSGWHVVACTVLPARHDSNGV